ncbi:acyl-CoA dehydrogenase family protein [bacterium]|nr:acyl-CoA dehydrogenase family protein [bacterium]
MKKESPSQSEIGRDALIAWEQSKPKNFFTSDSYFQKLAGSFLKHDEEMLQQLERIGESTAGRMNELAIESNRDENLPVLQHFDPLGNRLEQIVFHPSYDELGALTWATGVLRALTEPGKEFLMGSMIYLMAQNGEAGHVCPLACTAGAIKLIQQIGNTAQKDAYLPALLASDYSKRLHASQFLTEVQGGSDVGANACTAIPVQDRPGFFRIYGEKWFCSVVDAGIFVVTARPENATAGTKGLGLFLVPRRIDGAINQFTVNRLKRKLGTRSMATGEVEFHGAIAEQIGPVAEGFKNVVGIVLDTSRVFNALAACGFMRRAYLEARSFAEHRHAFGKTILRYPLVRRTLARMRLDACASIAATFRILAMKDEMKARRIHVNMNKYWTSIKSTQVARHGIEVLGGNGTIEDFSVLPRLYRDAIVIESWEGTHNTLCMQVLRDFVQREMQLPWLDEVRASISNAEHSAIYFHAERAATLANELEYRIDQLVKATQEERSSWIRSLVDRMCVLNGYVSLLKHCGEDPTKDEINLLEYYRKCYVDPTDPMGDQEMALLEQKISQNY